MSTQADKPYKTVAGYFSLHLPSPQVFSYNTKYYSNCFRKLASANTVQLMSKSHHHHVLESLTSAVSVLSKT